MGDSRLISVGNYQVGVNGLDQALEELAPTHAGQDDEQLGQALLGRLATDNYIPDSARADYARALVREFRRHLGQPVTEAPRQGLEIKILGQGCNRCESLTAMVINVLEEMKLQAAVEHLKDIKDIARYGVMGVPALVLNGKVAFSGSVPTLRALKDMITRAAQEV